ncbi:MAG: replication initiation protein RepC, partial [Mesorhizobium sp.]|uniref:plasmid replication protein RepC n=1 Tax=Mesorhizobium sp. TaxID=1871066 RepID=UPI001224255A
PRTASRQLIESINTELEDLWAEIRGTLESFTKPQNPDANESHSGAHIQNSNPDSLSDSENCSGKYEEAATFAENENVRSLPKRDLPLGIVLDACPNLRELAQGGQIRHWRDFLAAAEAARPMLGVSPSAWKDALKVLGEQQAAITLAAIYQRSAQINNAGGYLRSL